MSRRRGNDDAIVVIYWRDVPAQVSAGSRAAGAKVLLDARFQHAIDRAAVVAGKTDTQSYVAEWRRVAEPLTGQPEAAATYRAARLDAEHPDHLLEALVRNGGWNPDRDLAENDVTQ
jgi:hypothetical protein